MDAAKIIWRKLKGKDKVRFVTTTVVGILWPVYVAAAHPLGELPDAVQTGLWVLTGMVVTRLVIATALITRIHRDQKAGAE